jgi:hypothetical protein
MLAMVRHPRWSYWNRYYTNYLMISITFKKICYIVNICMAMSLAICSGLLNIGMGIVAAEKNLVAAASSSS